MFILTAVLFIGLLLALVLIHELGHFLAAKWAGCRVEEFAFGFPPKLFSYDYKGTKYSFNLLPIGGFVKIEGEDMAEAQPSPTSFATKSATKRVIILAAGVAMNIILAAVLLIIQAGIGFPTLITQENQAQLADHQTYILDTAPGSPAAVAGIQDYDRITNIDGMEDPTVDQIRAVSHDKAGQAIKLTVTREGSTYTYTITPRVNPPAGEGALGISLGATGLYRVPWWQAPWYGIKRTGIMLATIVEQFYVVIQNLVKTGNAGSSLTGPVGIAKYTSEAAKMGISYILEFTALISLNLAIINILPFPALDGGRIVFVILEKIRGRRLSLKFEQTTHTIGFGLLILLMIIVTLRDIKRFF